MGFCAKEADQVMADAAARMGGKISIEGMPGGRALA